MATIADLIHDLMNDPDSDPTAYLRATWLVNLPRLLRNARRQSGISESKMAQRLGVDVSYVVMMETNRSGELPVSKMIDYFLICGVLPYELEIADVAEFVTAVKRYPSDPLTVTQMRSADD